MAVDTTTMLSLLELAKRKDPNGDLATIAEVLTEENACLVDAPWMEANGEFSHKIVRRLSQPGGAWRQLNAGVATVTTKTKEVMEQLGMLEAYSEVDLDLAKASGNVKKFRNDEAIGIVEGMAQNLADTIMYGNAGTDPEQFTGLAPRLNSTSQTNVVSAGGSGGDTTSFFIVQWGERQVHLLYPKDNPNMGVKRTDMGERTQSSATTGAANTAQFQIYREHFQVKCGLAVHDERCIARYCNVEVSTPTTNSFAPAALIGLLGKMKNRGKGAFIYANDDGITLLEKYAVSADNVWYRPAEFGGMDVGSFRGRPVRLVDAILSTETAVS